MNPLDWGWKLHNNMLRPVYMDKSPAPPELLKIIHCSCTKDCMLVSRCSCRKNGLMCTVACKNCCESICGNMKTVEYVSQHEEEDDVLFEEDDSPASAGDV